MNVYIPENSETCQRIAQALNEEALNYPFARLLDVKVDIHEDNLGLVKLTAKSVLSLGMDTEKDVPVSQFMSPSTRKEVMMGLLAAVALLDYRVEERKKKQQLEEKKKDEPSGLIVRRS